MSINIEIAMPSEQFVEQYLSDLPFGGLFIPTTQFYGLGDPIHLSLTINQLECPVHINGTVAWHRRPRAWSSTLPSGIGFAFNETEQHKKNFLLQYASGKIKNRRFSGPRYMAEYPVKLLIDGTWSSAKTQNVGAGGLYILANDRVEKGSAIKATIYTDDSPTPTDCTLVITRIVKLRNQYALGTKFQRITPLIRKTFSKFPSQSKPTIANRPEKPQSRKKQGVSAPKLIRPKSNKHTIPIFKN